MQYTGGTEHWADKNGIKLFLWRKTPIDGAGKATILFVHGSSTAGQAAFDLQVPGLSDTSIMDWFVARGFDTWCLDNEGYGRSSKSRPINFNIENGADDLEVATAYIARLTGRPKLLLYGTSSGAQKSGLFAMRHPGRVARLALDAMFWTGRDSPDLKQRMAQLPELLAVNRRPFDPAVIARVFERDGPGLAEPELVEAFGRAVADLDDSIPTGTYVDACTKLPIQDPTKNTGPTLVLRPARDGIAAFADVAAFFSALATEDKQMVVLPNSSHAAMWQKNRRLGFQALLAFFDKAETV